MTRDLTIRNGAPEDLAAIEALYPAAFPDEDLLPLVRDLPGSAPGVLSLVATRDGRLAGHVVFTRGEVAGDAIALLGPLAVAPEAQRRGVGSALVREGLARLERAGVARVYVLGDPAYYGRFGFAPETDATPPCPLPAEWRDAWRSLGLGPPGPPPRGALALPPPWRRPELWAP